MATLVQMVSLWAGCGQHFSALPSYALNSGLIHPILEGVSSFSGAPGVGEVAKCLVKTFFVTLKKFFAPSALIMSSPMEYRGAPLSGGNAFPFRKISLALFAQTITWVACPW